MNIMKTKISHMFFYVLPEEYRTVRLSCNFNIAKVISYDSKKEMHWFWKKELNKRKNRKRLNYKRRL